MAVISARSPLAGCGDDDDGGSSDQLVVSAASSLERFTDYVDAAGIDAKQSFAGSDELAAQIRQGVTPDVYAAANTTLPDELYAEGLLEKPVVFATNSLVLAVPDGSDIDARREPGAARHHDRDRRPRGPVGAYTREVLDRLPPERERGHPRQRALPGARRRRHRRQAHAGRGRCRLRLRHRRHGAPTERWQAIELPSPLQPHVAYAAAVVVGANNPDGAREFIDGLLDGDGALALEEAGFKPPPG